MVPYKVNRQHNCWIFKRAAGAALFSHSIMVTVLELRVLLYVELQGYFKAYKSLHKHNY